jgi:hypothetical protein
VYESSIGSDKTSEESKNGLQNLNIQLLEIFKYIIKPGVTTK